MRLALGVLALLAPQWAASDTLDLLFQEGNAAYREGDFPTAISQYEAIRERGFASGELHYNLGTAYFKKGDVGRSIASYHRALRFLPRDGDLRSNLAFVERHTLDRAIVPTGLPPVRLLKAAAGLLTEKEWLWVIETAYAVSLALLGAFVVRPRLQDKLREPLLVLLGLLVLLVVLFSFSLYDQRILRKGVVLPSEVAMRSGPGEQFTREFLLHEGTVLVLHRETEGWVFGSVSADLKGWLPQSAIDLL